MSDYPLEKTPYGFVWGPLTIERAMSDPKWGVVLLVHTEKGEVGRIRCSPKGYSLIWEKVKGRD